MAQRRELPHVLDDRVVVVRVLERNENAFVHQRIQLRNVCTSSHALSTAITIATEPREQLEPERIGELAHLHFDRT